MAIRREFPKCALGPASEAFWFGSLIRRRSGPRLPTLRFGLHLRWLDKAVFDCAGTCAPPRLPASSPQLRVPVLHRCSVRRVALRMRSSCVGVSLSLWCIWNATGNVLPRSCDSLSEGGRHDDAQPEGQVGAVGVLPYKTLVLVEASQHSSLGFSRNCTDSRGSAPALHSHERLYGSFSTLRFCVLLGRRTPKALLIFCTTSPTGIACTPQRPNQNVPEKPRSPEEIDTRCRQRRAKDAPFRSHIR